MGNQKYSDEQLIELLNNMPDASNRQIILALGTLPNKSLNNRLTALREKCGMPESAGRGGRGITRPKREAVPVKAARDVKPKRRMPSGEFIDPGYKVTAPIGELLRFEDVKAGETILRNGIPVRVVATGKSRIEIKDRFGYKAMVDKAYFNKNPGKFTRPAAGAITDQAGDASKESGWGRPIESNGGGGIAVKKPEFEEIIQSVDVGKKPDQFQLIPLGDTKPLSELSPDERQELEGIAERLKAEQVPVHIDLEMDDADVDPAYLFDRPPGRSLDDPNGWGTWRPEPKPVRDYLLRINDLLDVTVSLPYPVTVKVKELAEAILENGINREIRKETGNG